MAILVLWSFDNYLCAAFLFDKNDRQTEEDFSFRFGSGCDFLSGLFHDNGNSCANECESDIQDVDVAALFYRGAD